MSVEIVNPPKSNTSRSRTMEDRVAELRERRDHLMQGGGPERIERQHAGGKLSARERIERLVDKSSFQELALFAEHRCDLFGMAGKEMPADGVVTGCATVDGRLLHFDATEFT